MKQKDKGYSLFNAKATNTIDLLMPSEKKIVTFLNPYSISFINDHYELYAQFDYICSDGILPVIMNRIWGLKNFSRLSFDFTSLACNVFEEGIKNNLRFYFLGTDEQSINRFVDNIKQKYPTIAIAGWHNGYIQETEEDILNSIIDTQPDITIVGMGTPYQDKVAIRLRKKGLKGAIYTCGGFFHQTAQKETYFPTIINKLHLRWLYRLIKEPHSRKRFFIHYPVFFFNYSIFLAKYAKKIKDKK
ncbi:WecB/TagA/CpsF family glycosyltransferase [Bacteroides heparinolyticus]|uniref:WecB/TagA/CpsF family glycosyltransferase n=1 Tax=Prevotella heparinolytica TaxID=28113 RepID=UPI00359FB3C7